MMVSAAACATPRKTTTLTKIPMSVVPLLTSQVCLPAAKSWTATWISSRDSLRQMMSRILSHRIGGTSHKIPSIDFTRHGVLAVEMGVQRTAGYGFDTKSVTAYMECSSAVVKIVQCRPESGAHTAQVMTSPCILLRLPKNAYDIIRVMDQQHNFLTQTLLP